MACPVCRSRGESGDRVGRQRWSGRVECCFSHRVCWRRSSQENHLEMAGPEEVPRRVAGTSDPARTGCDVCIGGPAGDRSGDPGQASRRRFVGIPVDGLPYLAHTDAADRAGQARTRPTRRCRGAYTAGRRLQPRRRSRSSASVTLPRRRTVTLARSPVGGRMWRVLLQSTGQLLPAPFPHRRSARRAVVPGQDDHESWWRVEELLVDRSGVEPEGISQVCGVLLLARPRPVVDG